MEDPVSNKASRLPRTTTVFMEPEFFYMGWKMDPTVFFSRLCRYGAKSPIKNAQTGDIIFISLIF